MFFNDLSILLQAVIDAEVKSMLSLKEKYRALTGKEWNPKLVEQVPRFYTFFIKKSR